jgi:hypothetical protein
VPAAAPGDGFSDGEPYRHESDGELLLDMLEGRGVLGDLDEMFAADAGWSAHGSADGVLGAGLENVFATGCPCSPGMDDAELEAVLGLGLWL